jgi:uncharacterized membrane protein (DUF106 family)
MSEMIERVAKAMARHRWAEFDEEQREAGRELARNAIEAMREPIPAMHDAAYGATSSRFEPMVPDFVRINAKIWRAMIDEALK